jgi:SAM-dependent methyltransferase
MDIDILELIKSVPQKYENFGTITHQMKRDIHRHFSGKELTCMEVGCYNGYTTNILSKFFKSVTALDNNDVHLDAATKLNSGNANVNFVKVDLYNEDDWQRKVHSVYEDIIDVALVDASHSYEHAKSDIVNAIKLGCKYIILDDVGVYKGIKKCVSEIEAEYASRIQRVIPIGIDWYHYKLPTLNVAIQPYRALEKNIGSTTTVPHWVLRDDSDIELNGGLVVRQMFNPMNVKLEVIINDVTLVSGHIESDLPPEHLFELNSTGPILSYTNTKSQDKNVFEFVPFPFHRFDGKNWNSMMSEDKTSQYDEDQTNFEGLIIELK